LGVVGESGSGKTTLAKILAGFLPADKGEATWGEKNLLSLSRHERASLVQMVFQDPFASLNPKLHLLTQLREAATDKTRLEEMMFDVGLSVDLLKVYPHQLSGGQRQRFAIARALAANPKLLLADEPVSSLDVSVQAQIINLLNELRQKRKFSQILISHDLSVVANMCERILVLKEGTIVELGSTEAVLNNPSHPYTQRLLAAAPMI
jgi:ABC-type glutathione transport system ATPase component